MNIPKNVKQIIGVLENNGYEAFAVGGCVRDTLLGRIPEDWDITTSAKPEEVKTMFRRTIDTGIEHGTVTIMLGDIGYEVTTYRIDGLYEDHRHPKEVLFTSNLIEDLKRRDFTINAMAYSPGTGIVDEFGGKEDLKNGIIRAVGDAKERFTEDALRMLRAIRFAGQLMFEIESKTEEGIRQLAHEVCHVSTERIRVELIKLLTSEGSEKFRLVKEFGLCEVFLPEWEEGQSLFKIKAVNHLCNQKKIGFKDRTALVFSALLYKVVDQSQASKICKRLTFDNDTVGKVEKLLRYYNESFSGERIQMRFAMNKIGIELLPLLFILQEADCPSKNDVARKCFEDICKAKDPITIKDLAITGKELLEIGIESGPKMGALLQYLMEEVLENPQLNQKETLQKLANQKNGGTYVIRS